MIFKVAGVIALIIGLIMLYVSWYYPDEGEVALAIIDQVADSARKSCMGDTSCISRIDGVQNTAITIGGIFSVLGIFAILKLC